MITANVLRRRLELAGFNRESLEREFQESIVQRISFEENLAENDWATAVTKIKLPLLKSTTLQDWMERLKIIVDHGLTTWRWAEKKAEYDDPLLSVLLTPDYWSEEGVEHDLGFPCRSLENLAVAMLEILPGETECVLDVTDLVGGGWTDAFEDLIEYNKEFTSFYEVFSLAISDTSSLIELSPDNNTLARLLYANVITALETYLSDTLKKQVLNKEAIKRRFIQTNDAFKEKMSVNDIFRRLENLNRDIVTVIDMISFHNLDKTTGLYKSVLYTQFPVELLPNLKRAIENRHDIVHRNGKTVHGQIVDISMKDVKDLIELVNATVQHIDKQVKDGLLDDEDE